MPAVPNGSASARCCVPAASGSPNGTATVPIISPPVVTSLDAELARIDGDNPRAIDLYMRAIEAAHAQGAAQITALAHELAAGFCRAHGLARVANTLVAAAMVEYGRWGATAKVEQLRQRHLPDHPTAFAATQAVSLSPSVQLDLLTVVKAAQSISSEVTTGRLHETLLRTLLEHVGAQCAHLLVRQHGQLHLKESARYEDNHFYLEHIESPAATFDFVPEMVVNYVTRARVPLVLDDACREGVFVHDPYFRQQQQCAVLCMPVLRRNDLIGVLYLENRQLAGAFSRVNLEVLEWLLAQVAISMENAGLYEDLQDSEARLGAVMETVPACVYMKDPQGALPVRQPRIRKNVRCQPCRYRRQDRSRLVARPAGSRRGHPQERHDRDPRRHHQHRGRDAHRGTGRPALSFPSRRRCTRITKSGDCAASAWTSASRSARANGSNTWPTMTS